MARQGKVGVGIGWECSKHNCREWWTMTTKLRRRSTIGAIHVFPEHNEEADAWAEKELEAWWRNGRTK